ncbi:hypothetical protein [Pseudomonas sp. S2_B07]
MKNLFISGSIKIKRLDEVVRSRLDNVISSGMTVLIGDAGGVDKSVQQYLLMNGFSSVKVYCTGKTPRNNEGGWPVVCVDPPIESKGRDYYVAKDLKMADDSDIGLMIWDCKSPGTLSNVMQLLRQKKKSVVYVSSKKTFLTVTSETDFKTLVDQMELEDYISVDKKISFSSILNFQPVNGLTDELFDKAEGLQRLIASHQAEIVSHEKTIAELKRQLEQLREPMDDMFSAL